MIPPRLNNDSAATPAERASCLAQQPGQPAHDEIDNQQVHEEWNPEKHCAHGPAIREQVLDREFPRPVITRWPHRDAQSAQLRSNAFYDPGNLTLVPSLSGEE